ncbi:MAG: EAL domain-containing protein [Methylocystaceae bacterium]|nr:EAL domain-containing protein [Methylocystaceae bacterium]
MAQEFSDAQVMKAIRAETNGPENKMLENLSYLEGKPQGQCAVIVHLSQLQAANRKPDYIRIAERAFDPITLAHNAELFVLGNFDIILTCPGTRVGEIDKALNIIRMLFQADPLIEKRDISGEELFSSWYDLEEDFDFFKESAVSSALEGMRIKLSSGTSAMDDETLTPKNLDQLARAFKKLDARPLMRHQSAVQIGANGQGQLLFREYFVSIADLRKLVAPHIDLLADRWLFQFLTTILDQRVLHMLRTQPLDDLPKNVSLNLNIQTIQSKDFQLFDQHVGNDASRFILEFQPVDVFSNIFVYEEVRDLLQNRGYKVLIDALQPLVLDYFDPSMLLADYYKIAWGDRLGGATRKDGQAEMRELIQSIGASKVVISHVDSEEAVRFGLLLGVQRFQGFFVDKLVEAMTQKAATSLKGA